MDCKLTPCLGAISPSSSSTTKSGGNEGKLLREVLAGIADALNESLFKGKKENEQSLESPSAFTC